MNNNFGEVIIGGKCIDLNSISSENLREILNKINDEEMMIKQELDNMLKMLE